MPNEFGTDAFDGAQQKPSDNAPQGGVGNQMPDVPPAPAPQQPAGAMPQQPGAPQTPYQQYQQPQYRQPSDPYVTPPGTVYGDNGIITDVPWRHRLPYRMARVPRRWRRLQPSRRQAGAHRFRPRHRHVGHHRDSRPCLHIRSSRRGNRGGCLR